MHPGDHSGHVIDLGIEFTNMTKDELKPIQQSYQQVFQSLMKEKYFNIFLAI